MSRPLNDCPACSHAAPFVDTDRATKGRQVRCLHCGMRGPLLTGAGAYEAAVRFWNALGEAGPVEMLVLGTRLGVEDRAYG